MNIQWYPGHMTKAKRAMKEDIKLIDLIIELVDARVPLSSRNPDIDELGKGKGRIILLNKSDLADEAANDRWMEYFKAKGFHVIKVNSRSGAGLRQLGQVVSEACREKIERDRRRGILNRPVRAMVVGIPNVGKSTFINSYAGKACAKTGNKPGILWPRFEDQSVGIRLACIGSVNDDILDRTELALELIKFLCERYPENLRERYEMDTEHPEEGLAQIARFRACLLKGGELDYEKAAKLFFDDFRGGRLGRITLELPEE